MKNKGPSNSSIELYPTFTCQMKLEYGKVSNDGNRQVHLVIETAKGVIFLKGFRVDKHFTDILMPMLPLGKFSSPYYLAGISPEIRKDILDVLQEEEKKNAEDAINV